MAYSQLKNYRKLPDLRSDIPIDQAQLQPPERTQFAESRRRLQILHEWKTTRNWDKFFERVYEYYLEKGMFCTLLARIMNLMTIAFVVIFASFLFSCIDHQNISKRRSLSEAIVPQCMSKLSTFHTLSLLIFAGFWLYELAKLVRDIPLLLQMKAFYNELLRVDDSELSTITWHEVVKKIVDLHAETYPTSGLSLPPRLSAHDIVNRIMRKENYLIALFNKDVLNLSVGGKQMLTKVLEWNLTFCVLNYVFGEADQGKEIGVRKELLRDTNRKKLIAGLKQRFILMGIVSLVLSPFILVFLAIYFLFKYGEEFHKHPGQISSRSYSPIARWKFRDFNELPHLFQSRLNSSYSKAEQYANQFPSWHVAIIAKFVAFVAGSMALSLTLLSILDDDILLNFMITPGRSVIWYLGLFGIVWSGARSLVPDSRLVFEPESLLMDVVQIIHYLPLQWKHHGLGSHLVHREFCNLFEMRIVLFMQEMASIVLSPFVLIFLLPGCAKNIVDFFREFTVHVDGVGWVCTFAVFDFRQFNANRGKLNLKTVVDMDEKLEQSVLNFKQNFPEWRPNDNESLAVSHEYESSYARSEAAGQEAPKSLHSLANDAVGESPTYPYKNYAEHPEESSGKSFDQYAPPFFPDEDEEQLRDSGAIELDTYNDNKKQGKLPFAL